MSGAAIDLVRLSCETIQVTLGSPRALERTT